MVSAIEDTACGRRAEAAPDPSWSGSTIQEPLKAGTLVAEPEDDEGNRLVLHCSLAGLAGAFYRGYDADTGRPLSAIADALLE